MKDRKKKRAVRFLLAVSSLALNLFIPAISVFASPEFAYTPEKWETLRDNHLEYQEIGDLIHEYNADVINNRLEYDDYRGKDRDDIKNAYSHMADMLYEASDEMMDSVSEEQPGYGITVAGAIGTRLQAEQNQETADAQNEDSKVKKLEYDKQEALLVKEAQTKMISCLQAKNERPVLEEALRQAEAEHTAMAVRASQGMASRTECLEAEEKIKAAKADLEANSREYDKYYRELSVMTGWAHDGQPELGEISLVTVEELAQLDPERDFKDAVEANYTQSANKRRLELTEKGTAWEVLSQKLKQGELHIQAEVQEKYRVLEQARADQSQAEEGAKLSCEKADAAGRKFALGMISQNQWEKEQKAATEAKVLKDKSVLSLRQAYEDYCWAVDGLAAVE